MSLDHTVHDGYQRSNLRFRSDLPDGSATTHIAMATAGGFTRGDFEKAEVAQDVRRRHIFFSFPHFEAAQLSHAHSDFFNSLACSTLCGGNRLQTANRSFEGLWQRP